MAETTFRGKITKPVTSRENTLYVLFFCFCFRFCLFLFLFFILELFLASKPCQVMQDDWIKCHMNLYQVMKVCLKAHLHPRVIAIVCFYFESLYCLNAWSDWLNAEKLFEKGAISSCSRQLQTTNFTNIHRNVTEYIQNNTRKLYNDKQGTYLHRRIKIYVQDPIVMKKGDDNRSLKFFESFVLHEIQICRTRGAMYFGWMWAFKTNEFHWWIPESRMHRSVSWGWGRRYHARQRRHKERHKFAYLTMKNNSFACFAQAIFISVHFADAIVLSTKWNDLFWSCGDAVGIPWRMLILSSYLWRSCSNLLPG